MQLLVFHVGGSRYALDLDRVQEAVRAVEVTEVPDLPDVVEGLIDVRGEVAPLYDLSLRFGHAPRPLHPDDRFVVARAGGRVVALHCERIEGFVTIDTSDVASADPLSYEGRWVTGAARLFDGLVLIHDPETFLTAAERETLDAAVAAASVPR